MRHETTIDFWDGHNEVKVLNGSTQRLIITFGYGSREK